MKENKEAMKPCERRCQQPARGTSDLRDIRHDSWRSQCVLEHTCSKADEACAENRFSFLGSFLSHWEKGIFLCIIIDRFKKCTAIDHSYRVTCNFFC